ncbi:synaptotagmin-like protein 5 [Dysidea avara]|uniref:synaptotagmin-like protein 5 n=1 Tax=Dysidea avara TaxID=196820 RepID=UPI00331A139C
MYTHDEVTGEIQMGVSYSDTDNALKVSINKVRGLTPPNKIDENHTNPYVKTYLLPDQSKSTKKKTSVKKGVDPIFNETIKYPIKRQELSKHTLKVGVWHNDFWRHNLFLGEVTLPLDKVDWSNPSDKWYGLEELSHDDTGQLTDRGQLKVSLQFNITNDKKQIGDLVVTIISGHNLLQTELTCNPVVKCHLLPDYRKKFKTKVLKDNSNPEWNEQFVFDHIKLEDLRENRVIELTVWNSTKNTKHYDFIGGLRLGPHPHHKKQLIYMDSSENELSHWMSIVNTPGECVEQLHTLRHNMDPLHMGVTSQQKVTSQHSLKTACKTPSSDGLDSGNNRMVVCSSRQLVDTPVHIGQVRVMLQYVPAVADTSKSGKEKCYLKVWIRQASGLKTHYDNGSFVLCTLLPKGKHQKFKSPVIENDENSVYNAKFQFDKVTDVELSYDRVLEITIWEPHRNTNEFVGGIRLGPRPQPGNKNKWMDSVGSEVNQWEIMMARPKEWIDEWHPLRLLNKPQNI